MPEGDTVFQTAARLRDALVGNMLTRCDVRVPQLAAANLTADPQRPLAEALLDQRVMAGIGNVYANELCFVFGQPPTGAVGALADPLRVGTRAHQMLWANRSRRGRTTTGDTRRGRELWAYAAPGCPAAAAAHRSPPTAAGCGSAIGARPVKPDADCLMAAPV